MTATDSITFSVLIQDPITLKKDGRKWRASHPSHAGIETLGKTRREAEERIREVVRALMHECDYDEWRDD